MNRKKFKDKLGNEILIFDGAMGSLLQTYGLKIGATPELFNLENPMAVTEIHKRYLEAGADIITANTFGAYGFKFNNLEEIISAAINNAKNALKGYDDTKFLALDMGPCGKLLEPMGDLTFTDCYNIFKETAILGEKYGADLAIIETFSDLYEAKAAILAIKENTDLPVIFTATLDENGRTLTGSDIITMINVIEGLGVDAIGVNCGLGPKQIRNFCLEILKNASIPVILQPNAGLPELIDGKAHYHLSPEEFSDYMLEMCKNGVSILGGCCGTTPDHIKQVAQKCKNMQVKFEKNKTIKRISSYSKTVELSDNTNTVTLCKTLNEYDIDDLIDNAMDAKDDGADCIALDFTNFKENETDELQNAVYRIQEMINTPLIIISNNTDALEKSLRRYNGRAGVITQNENSFPIIKKYGAERV